MDRWFGDLRTRWRIFTGRERRRWVGEGRLYVQARELPLARQQPYARAVRQNLEAIQVVRWARYNAVLGRVVIAHEAGADLARLVRTVDELDSTLQLADLPFREEPLPWDEPTTLLLQLERVIDLSGAGLAILRKVIPRKRRPGSVDLSAALTLLSSTPALRRALERRFGLGRVEVGLAAGSAAVGAWGGSVSSPLVDMIGRTLSLAAVRAQGRAWIEREPQLGGSDPEAHRAQLPMKSERPVPPPDGPIEAWSRSAVPAGLGAFGLGLTTSRSVASASGSLFGAVPKAAHLTRSSFAAVLSRRLAERGVLVRDERALELLDRIDTIVFAGRALKDEPRLVKALTTRARQMKLRLLVHGSPLPRPADGFYEVAAGDMRTAESMVREQIDEGRGVATVDLDAVTFSDLRIGWRWDADVVIRSTEDLLFLLDAMDRARGVSEQAVRVAGLQSVAGLLLSIRGLSVKEASRVAMGANLASAVGQLGGVRAARSVKALDLGGPPAVAPWHATGREETLAALGTRRTGLTPDEALERRPPPPPERSEREVMADHLADELDTPLTPVLLAGSALSALTGAVIDAGLIASVMGLDAMLGAAQRRRTEHELDSLASREAPRVMVWRAGERTEVDGRTLVVGDVIELVAGDQVPADCRLLHSRGLQAEEASLTGESQAVLKSSSRPCAEDTPVAERHTMLYAGTTVAAGSGLAVVVATGPDTEAQRGLVGMGPPPCTGVERRLAHLTELTMPVATASGVLLLWAGLARGRSHKEVISTAISLAVAAVPEGLPVLATLAQLAAAKRLASRGALVTNPRAVEALGRVTVLCADKTGTLTEGRIALRVLDDGSREAPPGVDPALDEDLLLTALRAGPAVDGSLAHPTDRAVHEGARALHERARAPEWRRIGELPFEPERGFHAVLGEAKGERLLCLKGEPEATIHRCTHERNGEPLGTARRAALLAEVAALGDRGLRVLAVARGAGATTVEGSLEGELRFVGLLGLADPVRPTARRAVRSMGEAGVTVTMITGDHPRTARAIARELGIEGELITGQELERLDDEELARVVLGTAVFARVTPSLKVRIVRAYQRRGHTVAMTGDGANDAPAIRLADVGVALGERATTAARTAADVVVADERIETIVHALLEGRALWTSVRDAVSLLVGGNLGEIVYTLTGGLISGRSPLNARQLLLINLLTDTIPAIAVAVMPPTEDAPERLAKEGPETSLGASLARDVGWRAAVTGGAATLTWIFARPLGTARRADSIALLTLVGGQLGQTLLVAPRSKLVQATSVGSLLLLLGIVQTPGLSHFFGCKPLGPIALSQAITGTVGATLASLAAPRLAERWAPRLVRPAGRLRRELAWWAKALTDAEVRAGFGPAAAPRRPAPSSARTGPTGEPWPSAVLRPAGR